MKDTILTHVVEEGGVGEPARMIRLMGRGTVVDGHRSAIIRDARKVKSDIESDGGTVVQYTIAPQGNAKTRRRFHQ